MPLPDVSEEFRESADTYKRFVEILNVIGEVFSGSGIEFGFRNHDYEIEE